MPFSSRSSSSSFSSSSRSSSSFSSYRASSTTTSFRSSATTIQSRPPAVGTVTPQKGGYSTNMGSYTSRRSGLAVGTVSTYHPGTTVIHQTVVHEHYGSSWSSCDMFHPFSPCSAWAPWSIWHTTAVAQPVAVVGQPGATYVPQQYASNVQSGPGLGFYLILAAVVGTIGYFTWRHFKRR